MNIQIRALQTPDRVQWESLYYGYADFYQVPMNDDILNAVWEWVFTEREAFYCLVAEGDDGTLLGLMHFREMPSPLRGKKVGFLDDLFVRPECRGGGVVEALFAALEQSAKEKEWPFVRWITAEDNYRGRRVYDKLSSPTNWRTYQLNTAS